MNHPTSPTNCRVFVVMVWQEQSHDPASGEQWRFRIEDPRTNQKRVFANPQGLIAALKEGAQEPLPPPEP